MWGESIDRWVASRQQPILLHFFYWFSISPAFLVDSVFMKGKKFGILYLVIIKTDTFRAHLLYQSQNRPNIVCLGLLGQMCVLPSPVKCLLLAIGHWCGIPTPYCCRTKIPKMFMVTFISVYSIFYICNKPETTFFFVCLEKDEAPFFFWRDRRLLGRYRLSVDIDTPFQVSVCQEAPRWAHWEIETKSPTRLYYNGLYLGRKMFLLCRHIGDSKGNISKPTIYLG